MTAATPTNAPPAGYISTNDIRGSSGHSGLVAPQTVIDMISLTGGGSSVTCVLNYAYTVIIVLYI